MKAPADRSYVWLFWLLATIGLAADQASKYGIFTWLYNDGTHEEEVFLGPFAIVSRVEPHAGPRDPYATRELKLVPGVFDIVASHTRDPHVPDDFGTALRTVSGPNRPYVNRGALFG